MSGIADILFVRFRVEDLARQHKFLSDFGFAVEEVDGRLLGRGTDPTRYTYVAEEGDPGFIALGFEAKTQGDLERIAALDGAAVEELSLPGGGLGARLQDPDGNAVEVVFGIEKPQPLTAPVRQPLNFGDDRQRLGERVSFRPGLPSTIVKRLGHCVLNVGDFRTSEAWYKQRFGLLTSDEIYVGEEDNSIGAFMRCNHGERHVDHHTLFLLGTGTPEFNHAAFEVADWDTLMLSHDLLQEQGYEHRWGVGKHLLGSQVFDYWKDPHGFTLEHFTDGDLMNESFGSHKAPVEQLLGSHWGPAGAP
ncbi:MAG: VOC family protein [Gammaproteobacteria bacterium]|nr:VOC family protein [Gammaproteobacteria bacterium]